VSRTLVSVIVPNHDYGAFLATAVESVVRQTHGPLELLILDDGSRDDSRDVAAALRAEHRHRFERFECLWLAGNGGKLRALNQGIPLVRGEITVILDADDYLAPEYVAQTVGVLLETRRRDPKVGFVYTDCWLVDTTGEMLARGRSTAFDRGLLRTSSYIPSCAPILTAALRGATPFDECILTGNKHHMWSRIVEEGWEGLYVSQPLFFYTMHDRNNSGIGRVILDEVARDVRHARILSGYWPRARVG